MVLPKEKTQPKIKLGEQAILIYGEEKIGKTGTFRWHNPGKTLFLNTDGGLNPYEVFQIKIETWENFLFACRDLEEDNKQFETIIIDTIDSAYRFCASYVCEKNDISVEAQLEDYLGFEYVREEFYRVFTKLRGLGLGLIFLGHQKETDGKQTIPAYGPGKTLRFLQPHFDIVGCCYRDSAKQENGITTPGKRWIQLQSNPLRLAGSRYPLPERIPLDSRTPEGYNNFVKSFEEAVIIETKTQSIINNKETTEENGN